MLCQYCKLLFMNNKHYFVWQQNDIKPKKKCLFICLYLEEEVEPNDMNWNANLCDFLLYTQRSVVRCIQFGGLGQRRAEERVEYQKENKLKTKAVKDAVEPKVINVRINFVILLRLNWKRYRLLNFKFFLCSVRWIQNGRSLHAERRQTSWWWRSWRTCVGKRWRYNHDR